MPTVHVKLWGEVPTSRDSSRDSSVSQAQLLVPALKLAESQQSLLTAEAVPCNEVTLNRVSPPVARLREDSSGAVSTLSEFREPHFISYELSAEPFELTDTCEGSRVLLRALHAAPATLGNP